MEKQTLTVEEAAKVLGISRNAAYSGARTGLLPVIRFGKRYLVPRVALERMLSMEGRQDGHAEASPC